VSPRHALVVVDGSNLATEGRTAPSLAQLEEAVEAFLEEQPGTKTIVVVDATFGHRISAGERARFKDAELAGDLVTPPAGAIGRGDAFILKIAARSNAVVLSNDSFQEFQEEHPWLFDDGRLIGGKPVRGVGWIFTTRNPVRAAPRRAGGSIRATSGAKPAKAASSAASPGTAAPGTAPPAAARAPRAKKAAAARAPATAAALPGASRSARKAAPATKGTRGAGLTPPAKAQGGRRGSTKAARAQEGKGRAEAASSETRAPRSAPRAKAQKAAAPAAAPKRAAKRGDHAVAPTSRSEAPAGRPRKAARAAKAAAPRASAKAAAAGSGATSLVKRDDTPVNALRAFQALTSRHPVRSQVDGEVTSFTSHGAMITVVVGRGTKVACYVPLAGLGRPAPTRARDVLKLGEHRTFRISSYDEDRRIAELSLVASG